MRLRLSPRPRLHSSRRHRPRKTRSTWSGLSSGKAVIQLSGSPKPRVLRDGDQLPGGIKLIKATPESALFEINGKRRSLTLGSNQISNARSQFQRPPAA